MNEYGNKKELLYQISMSYAKSLLDNGVITEEIYRTYEEKMFQKYQPSWSRLFTDLSLEIT